MGFSANVGRLAAPAWPIALALHIALLIATAALLGFLLAATELYATALVTSGVLALAFASLVRHTARADRHLLELLEALSYGEVADRPIGVRPGSGLASRLEPVLRRLRTRNAAMAAERSRLDAVIEHAPVPLLLIEADDRVTLLNGAGRRLFDPALVGRRERLLAAVPDLTSVIDIAGGRQVVRLASARGEQRALATAATHIVAGRPAIILSLEPIEGELGAMELKAWEDLARVLAHEIMTSLTPAASLAGTALHILKEMEPDARVAELVEAVDAIHRRSGGLIRFIENYRRFAEPPLPVVQQIGVAEVLERACRLARGISANPAIRFESRVNPPELKLQADADLIDQALLALLKNAIEAVQTRTSPNVRLHGGIDSRGHVVIDVTDNGPGMPDAIAERAFVPFFTTKPAGSGIGLSVVRQIMAAHNGTIAAIPAAEGAVFRLTF